MSRGKAPVIICFLRSCRARPVLTLAVIALVGLGVGKAIVQVTKSVREVPEASGLPPNLPKMNLPLPSVSPPVISGDPTDPMKPLQCDNGRGGTGAHFENDDSPGKATPEEVLAEEIARRPGSLLASAVWSPAGGTKTFVLYAATVGEALKGFFRVENLGDGWKLNGYGACGELLIRSDGEFIP